MKSSLEKVDTAPCGKLLSCFSDGDVIQHVENGDVYLVVKVRGISQADDNVCILLLHSDSEFRQQWYGLLIATNGSFRNTAIWELLPKDVVVTLSN